MSYRELSAWGSLFITLVIFGNYFFKVGLRDVASAGLLAGTVISLIVVEIIYNALIAAWEKIEPRDERDRLIDLKAANNASWVSTVGLIVLISSVLIYRSVNVSDVLDTTLEWVNAVVFILIASECARFASQAIGYRRGA